MVPLEYGRVPIYERGVDEVGGTDVELGTNSTFMYSVLFESIQTWLSSLLAATFALPDPTLFDILDSPTPGQSLAATLSATAITALILAPIDIYRITYHPTTPYSPCFCLTLSRHEADLGGGPQANDPPL